MAKTARQRIPKLRFTSTRGIGWHVAYRDKSTGNSKRHRFGIEQREREPDARALYHQWLSEYLGGKSPLVPATITAKRKARHVATMSVASSLSKELGERASTIDSAKPIHQGAVDPAPSFRGVGQNTT